MIAVVLVAAALLPRDGTGYAARQVQSVLSMLDLRSPGARAAGSLADTKPPRQRALGKVFDPPRERALGKVFDPPQGAGAPGADVPFTPPFQPDTLDIASLPPALLSEPLGGGGGGAGGGGGGGGIPDGGTPTGPPVAAVPEPGTWLMMIVAFGFCGVMLRRGRRSYRQQSACAPA